MKLRLISAGIGIPAVALAIWGGMWGIGVLAVLSGLVTGRELGLMSTAAAGEMSMAARRAVRRLSNLTTWPVLAITIVAILDLDLWSPFTVAIGLLTIVFAAWAVKTDGGRFGLAALFYGVTLAHAPALATLDHRTAWLTMAIFGTFAVDTGSLVAGLSLGRHRMAPIISPKKTWEGAAGGLLAGIGAAIAISSMFGIGLSVALAGGIGAAIAIVGIAGDLYESWLKRGAGVKDSGSLIPGHGGILDRIDSLAPNLVTVYWLALWSGV